MTVGALIQSERLSGRGRRLLPCVRRISACFSSDLGSRFRITALEMQKNMIIFIRWERLEKESAFVTVNTP